MIPSHHILLYNDTRCFSSMEEHWLLSKRRANALTSLLRQNCSAILILAARTAHESLLKYCVWAFADSVTSRSALLTQMTATSPSLTTWYMEALPKQMVLGITHKPNIVREPLLSQNLGEDLAYHTNSPVLLPHWPQCCYCLKFLMETLLIWKTT